MLKNVNDGAIAFSGIFWLVVLVCTFYQIRKLAHLKKETENESDMDIENSVGKMRTEAMIDFGGSCIGRGKIQIKFLKISGKETDETKKFKDQQLIIVGRNELSDVCIEDRQVSRHHANIFCEHRNVFITDCNSTNHTYVDGREIPAQTPVKLTKDSMVSMGETEFQVILENE